MGRAFNDDGPAAYPSHMDLLPGRCLALPHAIRRRSRGSQDDRNTACAFSEAFLRLGNVEQVVWDDHNSELIHTLFNRQGAAPLAACAATPLAGRDGESRTLANPSSPNSAGSARSTPC